MKYVTATIGNIVTQIAKKTETEGYTVGVLEVFLPDENKMSEHECNLWIEENNKRMNAICKFLNDNNL